MNVGGSLLRRSFDKDGNTLKTNIQVKISKNFFIKNKLNKVPSHEPHNHHSKEHSSDINFDALVQSFRNQEGCQLYGTIIINKVSNYYFILLIKKKGAWKFPYFCSRFWLPPRESFRDIKYPKPRYFS